MKRELTAGCPRIRRFVEGRLPYGWIRPLAVMEIVSTRSGMPAGLQLVCGAGPYELEVLIQDLERDRRIEVAGQVTHARSVFEAVSGLPVTLLLSGDEPPLARTTTDGFGEFDLRSRPQSRLGLRLGDDADAPCVLVWEEFS